MAEHGEGVFWDPAWPGPRWVDMLRGDVLEFDEGTGIISRMHLDASHVVLVRPRQSGGMVVVTATDVHLFDPSSDGDIASLSVGPVLRGPALVPGERFNEGTVDPDGRLLLGTLRKPRVPGGASLYRLEIERCPRLVEGLTLCNGAAFDHIGDLFHVDSAQGVIRRFAYASGDLSLEGSVFVDVGELDGEPDGMCIDADGGLWVAMYGGGVVHRYSAEGEITHIVRVPVSQPTACCIAPDGSGRLLISTSSLGVPEERVGGAGALFWADVNVAPAPTHLVAL
ncbi:SMP-30/gluconolactonase/LRE family protein [Microbacterium pseudoresistens]